MEETEPDGSRARILIAIGAAVVLTAVIAVIAVASGGGSEERPDVIAPEDCVTAWNRDQAALAYGRHNFSFHLYEGALVTYLTKDGEEVESPAGGALCAVIFPSEALDSEPVAAGQVLRGKLWFPISELEGVELSRLAELQVLAAGSPNTRLDVQGVLTAL